MGFSPVVRTAFQSNHTDAWKGLTVGSFLMLSLGLDAVIRNPLYDGWRAQEPRNAVYLDIFGSREVEGDVAGLLAKSARPLVGEYLCGRQTDELSPGPNMHVPCRRFFGRTVLLRAPVRRPIIVLRGLENRPRPDRRGLVDGSALLHSSSL